MIAAYLLLKFMSNVRNDYEETGDGRFLSHFAFWSPFNIQVLLLAFKILFKYVSSDNLRSCQNNWMFRLEKHPNITLLHFTISWYQITYCKPFRSIKMRNYHQISILPGSRCRWLKWRGQPLLQLPVSQNMSFLSISHISI